ncbi:hypothetical protein C3007_04640 [Avibacterium gallinarum]|uniref:Heparinase II/III-like protein n=1 Tax=Avibacterium gallinarum TaxID=755 RepID=A0A379AYR6_AVIGA|nr:heparinase II/III family protein [Avibacterium gallinarum]POY44602.1 hypothetical protein C3007_04640 [Avibacterium gallinarum]TDP30392.1 heparinase II/III-like protein [Avibacterium gallinarum]SUB26892.1 Uncharacterised protein [Avibacterium gallinarum]
MKLPKSKYSEYISLRNSDIIPSWSIKPVSTNVYEAITPNKLNIQLSNNINDTFSSIDTPQYQSTMLWYHSLSWLRIIFNKYYDYEFVNNFIDIYYNFLNSQESQIIFDTLTSRDHLVAEQIRNLTYFLVQEDNKFFNKKKARSILLTLIDWAIQPSNIANNNHGMMLASSLLHTPLFLNIDPLLENNIINLASKRLIEIIKSAFDAYGLCNENTPAYQKFYIKFLKQQICELLFLKEYEPRYSVIADELDDIMKIAQHTLDLIALPNGTLPPFGDGNLSSQTMANQLDYAEFYSLDSGFYSIKHKRFRSRYFSMKCGYSSTTHKHSDDTSIFYWYDGIPIITDAGFLNYDWKDPCNVLVKSQRGHSGAFYYKYDHFYPIALYQDGSSEKSRILSHMIVNKEGNLTIIKGSVTIDHVYHVERTVQFSHLNNILITDRFRVEEDSRYIEKCARFLIPSEHKIEKHEGFLLISNDKFILKLIYKSGNVVIKKGVIRNSIPYGGWIVKTPFKSLQECNTIEIFLDKDENFLVINLLLEELE